jgi:hypothetical protein
LPRSQGEPPEDAGRRAVASGAAAPVPQGIGYRSPELGFSTMTSCICVRNAPDRGYFLVVEGLHGGHHLGDSLAEERPARREQRTPVRPGQVVLVDGDPSGDVLAVAAGRLKILVRLLGADMVLGIALPGDTIGDVSLFDHAPRAATVDSTISFGGDLDQRPAGAQRLTKDHASIPEHHAPGLDPGCCSAPFPQSRARRLLGVVSYGVHGSGGGVAG